MRKKKQSQSSVAEVQNDTTSSKGAFLDIWKKS